MWFMLSGAIYRFLSNIHSCTNSLVPPQKKPNTIVCVYIDYIIYGLYNKLVILRNTYLVTALLSLNYLCCPHKVDDEHKTKEIFMEKN